VLQTLAPERVARFRQQVEVSDWSGEEDPARLGTAIAALVARSPGRFAGGVDASDLEGPLERFTPMRPGGVREPLQYDPKGYFVITLDRTGAQIILRHFLPDHTPAHEMRGHAADAMLLGLLREGLVSQLSHAGYLGEELAKAEAALRLDLRYDQDRPLRRMAAPAASPPADAPALSPAATGAPPSPAPGGMPRITPPATWEELAAAAPGASVDAALAVTAMPEPGLLEGGYLASDATEPFSVFHRTPHTLRVRWSPGETRVIMGAAMDVVPGALLRVRGAFTPDRLLVAEALVILTRVARVE
jgi:hypothetical protein